MGGLGSCSGGMRAYLRRLAARDWRGRGPPHRTSSSWLSPFERDQRQPAVLPASEIPKPLVPCHSSLVTDTLLLWLARYPRIQNPPVDSTTSSALYSCA